MRFVPILEHREGKAIISSKPAKSNTYRAAFYVSLLSASTRASQFPYLRPTRFRAQTPISACDRADLAKRQSTWLFTCKSHFIKRNELSIVGPPRCRLLPGICPAAAGAAAASGRCCPPHLCRTSRWTAQPREHSEEARPDHPPRGAGAGTTTTGCRRQRQRAGASRVPIHLQRRGCRRLLRRVQLLRPPPPAKIDGHRRPDRRRHRRPHSRPHPARLQFRPRRPRGRRRRAAVVRLRRH